MATAGDDAREGWLQAGLLWPSVGAPHASRGPGAEWDRFSWVLAVARLLAALADAGRELRSPQQARRVVVAAAAEGPGEEQRLRAYLSEPPAGAALAAEDGELRLSRLLLSLLLWRRASDRRWDAAAERAFVRVLRTCAMPHARLLECHRRLGYDAALRVAQLRDDLRRYVCESSPGQLRALGADYGDSDASAAEADGRRRLRPAPHGPPVRAAPAPEAPSSAFDVDVFHAAGRTVVLIDGVEYAVAGRPACEGAEASLYGSLHALGVPRATKGTSKRPSVAAGEDAGHYFDRTVRGGVLCVDARRRTPLLRGVPSPPPGPARFVLLGPREDCFRPVLGPGRPLPGYGGAAPPRGVVPGADPSVVPYAETFNAAAALLHRAAARGGGAAQVPTLQRALQLLLEALAGRDGERAASTATGLVRAAVASSDAWIERARFLCLLLARAVMLSRPAAGRRRPAQAQARLPEPWLTLLASE